MCKKLCGTSDILQAPPRQSLKIFGGDLDITEFRNNKKILVKIPFNSKRKRMSVVVEHN